jgi:hypothetical protein
MEGTMTQTKRRRLILGALGLCILAGCAAGLDFNHFDTSHPTPDGGEESDGGPLTANDAGAGHVQLSPISPLVMRRGSTGSVLVSIIRNGNDGVVDLTVTGLPADVTVAPASIAAGATTATLAFTAGPSSDLSTSTVIVHAAEDAAPLQLTIRQSRLDPTFGDGGIVLGAPHEVYQDSDFDSAEHPFIAVVGPPTGGLPRNRFYVYKIDASGTSTLALGIHPSDTQYRMNLMPNGDFVVLSIDGRHLDAWTGDSNTHLWSALLPQYADINLARIRVSKNGTVVLIADATLDATTRRGIVLAQYSSDGGKADPSFGDAGQVAFPIAGEDDSAGDILLTDAGIVACSDRAMDALPKGTQFALVRVNGAGAIDRTFADGGAFVAFAGTDSVQCGGLTTDGRSIITANTAYASDRTTHAGLSRFGADNGALDLAFGDLGLVTRGADLTEASAVAIGASGSLLTAGATGPNRDDETALLFDDLPDGGPNLLFGAGDGGAFPLSIGSTSQASNVHVLANGSVVISGSATVDGNPTWFVARLLP